MVHCFFDVYEHDYRKLYKKAYDKAVSSYGDKQKPLSADERENWYCRMEVQPKNRPTKQQLKSFLELEL